MPYTDWIPVLDLIHDKKTSKILEFGIGEGTRALVKNFGDVFSLEILDNKDWFQKMYDELKSNDNFGGLYIDAPELFAAHKKFVESAYPTPRGQNFQDERPSKLLLDILERTKAEIDYSQYQVFFVDAGVYLRGEIVNFVKQFKPRYILVHDTNGFEDYGYDLAQCEDYLYLNFQTCEGCDGTGLFIRKEPCER